jgi:glycerol-3-phosphate acyltransferase PlsY
MNTFLLILIAILISYLIGTIPCGLIVARVFGKIDIRKFGSGNIGATNVGRTMGFKWFIVVFLLDLLKGLLPVLLIPWLMFERHSWFIEHIAVLCGLAVVIGHNWPVWLNFKGGKGVATGLGTVIILGPQASLVAGITFLLSMAATRIVSISSILGAIAFALVQIWILLPNPFSPGKYSLALFALVVPGLIIARHWDNIRRLWQGKEQRIDTQSVNKP